MKIKLIVILSLCVISTGCASTSDRAARDFLDGATASAEKRQREESTNRYSKKRDHKNDAIEDMVSGALTALFRGLFSSESDDN